MYRYINTNQYLQDYEGINQQRTNRNSIRVLPFKRVNKENVNELYRKILKLWHQKKKAKKLFKSFINQFFWCGDKYS
jgi:hypothetical protein